MGDKAVGIWMRKGDLGEEDKEKGRGLGWVLLLFLFSRKTLGEGGRGETGIQNFFGDLDYGIGVARIFGSGANKSNFLELGSQRGSISSWLGGNSFRQF